MGRTVRLPLYLLCGVGSAVAVLATVLIVVSPDTASGGETAEFVSREDGSE